MARGFALYAQNFARGLCTDLAGFAHYLRRLLWL